MQKKGTPVRPYRVPLDLVEEMTAEIRLSHDTRQDEPWTETDFVKIAIRNFIRQRKHSRTWRKRKTQREAARAAEVAALMDFSQGVDKQAQSIECCACSG